jgi:uncharacterized protein (TIGR02268 family)
VLTALPLLSVLSSATPSAGVPSTAPDCEAAPLALEVHAEPGAPPPVLCISPEVATTLRFDALLAPGAVQVQATEQEVGVAQGPEFISLLPSSRIMAGEWRKLTVRFGDGAAPEVATLLLYVHPARAARQVDVRRQVRTVGSYQREVEQQQEQIRLCQEENAHLRAAQDKPEGLRGLLNTGFMGEGGIAYLDLITERPPTLRKGSALKLSQVRSYRSSSRVAVAVQFEFPVGAQPWVAEGATLEDAQGRALRVLPLWQEATPEGWPHVIVEAEAKSTEAQGPYTLKLWEAGGKRTVTVEGIAFPPLMEGPAG